ncbi:uncharacterized protein LOC107265523 isoform X1 [Cephus cinctus]|uniref:Uncharacterized protein LOC107265523 isoform X1 n=1 Tax=Cephus cinctus TaxID=211228 RepID=A0AAJ7BNS3_CEPCN|nr:uncharacterized protein LOC107265523 isoform X1 [Cephus cinctus]
MLRHILSNLTSTGVPIVPSTERMNVPTLSSTIETSLLSTTNTSSTPGTASTAVNAAGTIVTNPSTGLTGVVFTATSKPDQHHYNATGYVGTEHDELDYSILAAFSDMQTVFLACISTLLPLILALGIAFAIRHVWRKYRNRRSGSRQISWYRGICSRYDTTESLHHRPHSGTVTIQPATRVLSAQDLVNGIDGPRYICQTEVMEEAALVASNMEYASPGNHTSKNPNGNIITLTLKNNHLIVETEERAVTMEDKNRKYEDSNCSFVVEVQPGYQSDETDGNKGSTDDVAGRVTDQQALVHREEIPEDQTSGFENTKLFGSTNTGLSQSDLSISSEGSANPSYRYGNQVEYDAGHFGYSVYAGYETDLLSRKLEGGSKWVEFDKSPDTEKTLLDESKEPSIDTDASENLPSADKQINTESSNDLGSSIDQSDSTDASISTDTVRSNPNLQVNGTIPNKLEIMEQKALSIDFGSKPVITGALLKDDTQEDTIQEQQRKLGNGTLTPEKIVVMKKDQPGLSFVQSHKRSGSVPTRLIEETLELDRSKKSLDIYSQIKTSSKSILPGLNPKFELLQNEVSPIEENKES